MCESQYIIIPHDVLLRSDFFLIVSPRIKQVGRKKKKKESCIFAKDIIDG